MIGMRWAIRCAGLLSVVILARVLTPEDFGIVAMSGLVYGLLQICAEMGASQLLLRTRELDRNAYDTAWTITLLQSFVLAVVVFALAHPAAIYFKEPRLVSVLQVVALGSVLNGATNIGLVMFRRDLEFKRDFLFGFYSKVLTVVPTVILALIYRSYWALIAGQIVGHLFEVLISYVMHPFRPRFTLAGWRRFVSFSLWTTPSNIANFLSRKADVFVVGHLASASQLGAYSVASELSRMATAEIVIPMSRALYPNYAKLKDDPSALADAFSIVLRAVCLISFAFGFGIAAVADDVVKIILGDQWRAAGPLVAWLGIFGAFAAILSTLTGHILLVLERERTMLVINWAKLAIFGISVLLAARTGDPANIAMASALSTAAITLGCAFYLPRVLPVSTGRLILDMLTILLAGVAMLLVVKLFHSSEMGGPFLSLLIDASIGAVVFVAIVGIAWIAAGRPDGLESRLMRLIRSQIGAGDRRPKVDG